MRGGCKGDASGMRGELVVRSLSAMAGSCAGSKVLRARIGSAKQLNLEAGWLILVYSVEK